MRMLKITVAIATLLAGGATTTPAAADPYCDCLIRCEHRFTPGTFQFNACVGQCELDYGPGVCKASLPKDWDRR